MSKNCYLHHFSSSHRFLLHLNVINNLVFYVEFYNLDLLHFLLFLEVDVFLIYMLLHYPEIELLPFLKEELIFCAHPSFVETYFSNPALPRIV